MSGRRRLRQAGFLLYVAVAGLLLTELVVRLFGIGPALDSRLTREGSWWVEDSVLPYRPEPLSVYRGRNATDEYDYEHRHNSEGFRDVEHQRTRPPGTFRILGLGDSFANGWGAAFEQSPLYLLESELNRRPGQHPAVEIIKAGIGGYSPEAERMLLESVGLAYSPDLVLVAFTPTDVRDTFRGLEAIQVSVRGYMSSPQARALGSWGVWLFEHWRSSRRPLQALAYLLSDQPPWDDIYREAGQYENAWLELERIYAQMLAASRGAGARLVVLHVPVATGERDAYPARRLADWCARHGVVFIDALPELRRAVERGVQVYWPEDGHCTPQGYRVIADALLRELLEAGLVP